jgi:hypothetical protein
MGKIIKFKNRGINAVAFGNDDAELVAIGDMAANP